MSRNNLVVWLLLILVPLVPVVFLYWFFGEQNYFELKGTAQGILATGPIAAYFAGVWVGWKLFSGVVYIAAPAEPALKNLPGEWDLVSTSIHGSSYTGKAQLDVERSVVSLAGSFLRDGKVVGSWESQVAFLKGNKLYVLYEVTELTSENVDRMSGVCVLSIPTGRFREMNGIWMVVGRDGKYGSITYRRLGETL